MTAKPRFFATPAAFRAWLDANHTTAAELLVGFYKTTSGKPSITWPESVDEALCFGWIDAKRKSLGDEAYTIRFVPRKPTSIWSAINVAKVEALRTAGKMRPAGEAAFAKRTAAKTGVYSFERNEAAVLSKPQRAQLAANAKAHAWFTTQAPSYQRTAIHWVISAKQEATRERRLATLIADSAAGRRIAPLRVTPKPKKQRATFRLRIRRARGTHRATTRLPMTSSTDRIVKTAVLKAPLARVWHAISDAKSFGTWFGVEIAGSFSPGARMSWRITPTKVDPEVAKSQEPYAGTPFEIIVDKIEPMRLFSFRWHPHAVDTAVDYSNEPMTLIEFQLEEVAGGTKLTITESGFDKIPLERRAKAFAGNEGGWTAQLELIAKFLAGAHAA